MSAAGTESIIRAGDRVKVVARGDRLPRRIPVGTVAKVFTVWKGQDAPYQLEGYDCCLMEDCDLELVSSGKEDA